MTIVGVVLVLASTAVLACGGESGSSTSAITVSTSRDKLAFEPSAIRVPVGEPVKLVLDNSAGTVLHDFTIDKIPVSDLQTSGGADHQMGGIGSSGTSQMTSGGERTVHVAASRGEKATIEFKPGTRGEYTFYCTVEGHQQAGMQGKLIVQ